MQRLKTREQFQAALAGRTVARTTHFAMHSPMPEVMLEMASSSALQRKPVLFPPDQVLIGAMVPKRWARRAVTRNLIKRQIYSVAQGFESRLDPTAHVVRLRSTFDRSEFTSASSEQLKKAVRSEVELLFRRAVNTEIQASTA